MSDNKSGWKKVIEQITGLFLPIINYLTAASILKSVVILLAQFHVLDVNGGVYKILFAASDGFFYFLPFFLAVTASKQWKTDLFISLLIPVAMLYPDITAILENGKQLSFIGLPILPAIYHSSVIPVLMAVGLLHFVEIPCDKWIPASIRSFLKPIICCLIVIPCTFLLFGPIGGWIGNALTGVFDVLYNWNPVVAGAFMGFVIQPMVVVGAQWSIVPVSIAAITSTGHDVIMPLLCGAVYGQCGTCLALALITKQKSERTVMFQASLSCALGVTEPALFGVTVARPRAMLSACFAGAVGGAIAGFGRAQCSTFAFPSLVTSVAFAGPGFAMFLLSIPTGFLVSFVVTFLQRRYFQRADNSKTAEQ
ncbi:MAG: PTS transporter subunit EIIC [Treponema sp.]|nr:PTS transporter subunit EIIC [Treponema sp.]MBO6219561.1 PTS transporter subunit EIIC [Treponema sp.]